MSDLNSVCKAAISTFVAGCVESLETDVFFTRLLYQGTIEHASGQTHSVTTLTASPRGIVYSTENHDGAC